MDDQLRASDADRDHAAEQLRAHYIAGRLARDEFSDRLATALSATTLGGLSRVMSDLPPLVPAAAPAGRRRSLLAATAGALRVRYQAAARRRLRWRVAATLIGVGVGAVAGSLAGIPFATVNHPLPTATDTVTFTVTGPLPTGPGEPGRYFADLAGIATSRPVLANLGRYVPGGERALRQHVSARLILPPLSDGGIVDVSVQARNAPTARAWAVQVAEDYAGYFTQLQLQTLPNPPAEFAKAVPDLTYDLNTRLAPPGPVSSNAGESSALGALIGALLGALTGMALGWRRRWSNGLWGRLPVHRLPLRGRRSRPAEPGAAAL